MTDWHYIPLPIDKDHHIALWKALSTDSNGQHVVLTHGTFSTKTVLTGIVEHLQQAGFTCWIFEWRNHGDSAAVEPNFNFETIAQEDCRLVLDYLIHHQGIQQIHGITHSGGGICLSLALLLYPIYQSYFMSLTFFACQAFGAAYNRSNYAKIWVGKYLSKLLGRTPINKVGGEQDEYYPLMQQWFDWNLSGQFIGQMGTAYEPLLPSIQVPILSICGEGDTFIAPLAGCRRFLDAFDNPNNRLLYCSKANGFAEAYTHSRIIRSRNAQRELYPQVVEWMGSWTL